MKATEAKLLEFLKKATQFVIPIISLGSAITIVSAMRWFFSVADKRSHESGLLIDS